MTVTQRLSFFAQLSNCNLATCWRIELSMPSPPCNQHSFEQYIALFVTWTKFIQIPNAVQPKPMKMERIVGSVSREFFWSVEIEQPLLVAKLTRAEINGLAACRCVWRPPSLNEILFILIWCPFPLPACSSQVLFERSSHAWTKSELICKQANEVRAMWDAQHKRCYGNKFESLNAYCVRL